VAAVVSWTCDQERRARDCGLDAKEAASPDSARGGELVSGDESEVDHGIDEQGEGGNGPQDQPGRGCVASVASGTLLAGVIGAVVAAFTGNSQRAWRYLQGCCC